MQKTERLDAQASARLLRKELVRLLQAGEAQALRSDIRAGRLDDLTPEEKEALPREAARLGRLDLLRVLCEESHVIALCCDEAGRDLLHYAAMSGDAACTAYVTDCLGFDPLRGDREGRTALDYAANAPETLAWLERRVGFSLAEGYRNPVRRGFYPDPSVVRVGEDYYLVNSTFVQFPCLPISHSRDLVHWQTIGHAIDCLEWSGIAGLPGGFGYWAPDISYFQGRFWVVATLRRNTEPFRLQMITSSERPEGPYEKPRFLNINGIDPSLFADDDGKRYLVVNPGAQIVELGKDGEMLGKPQMIYYGSVRVKTEGPHLLKKDGWYYLFQAEGGTGAGHMETVARSRNLRGPYEPCPHNPILGRKETEAPIRRSGHGKPFSTPDGRWYMAYLCGRDAGGVTMLGRETALDPLTWTADGWPMVNGLRGPSCLQRAPFPAGRRRAGAAEEIRALDFIAPRTDARKISASVEGGWRLSAGGDLHGLGCVSMLMRRQSERAFEQSVTVDACAMQEGMAGLCGYYDENSFFLFGLKREGGGWVLAVCEQAGAQRREQVLSGWPDGKAALRVMGDGRVRILQCREGEGWRELIRLDAVYLGDEGVRMGKRFTGATLGMAAVGQGEAVFTAYRERMQPTVADV